jgi:hypothetical protein
MSNYPPGVSGNEPQITGEWPCGYCGGASKYDPNEYCPLCKGSGIHPEEAFELKEVEDRIIKFLNQNTDLGLWIFDEDDDGNFCIHTNLRVYGHEWVRVESD